MSHELHLKDHVKLLTLVWLLVLVWVFQKLLMIWPETTEFTHNGARKTSNECQFCGQ